MGNILTTWLQTTGKSYAKPFLFSVAMVASVNLYAANVLLLNEQCSSVAYAPTALTNQGHTTTEVNTWADFNTQLAGGTWDLVVVDSYNDNNTDDTVLAGYITAGGRAIVAHWDISADTNVTAALEVTPVTPIKTPLAVQVWSPSDALFTTPYVVADQTPIADICGTDGYRSEPTGTATALAGYAASATANEAAIIRGNGGKTLYFGFTPGLFDTTMVNLYENAITSVLTDPPAVSSSSSGGGALHPLMLILMFIPGIFFIRRNRRAV